MRIISQNLPVWELILTNFVMQAKALQQTQQKLGGKKETQKKAQTPAPNPA